jgi:hypothetical protein
MGQEQDKIPLFKTWKAWYAFVLIVLAVLILSFYFFTKRFA